MQTARRKKGEIRNIIYAYNKKKKMSITSKLYKYMLVMLSWIINVCRNVMV